MKIATTPKKKSAPAPAPAPAPVVAPVEMSQEEKEAEEEFFQDAKEHFNIVFIGHVDAGKSTMGGHLLCVF